MSVHKGNMTACKKTIEFLMVNFKQRLPRKNRDEDMLNQVYSNRPTGDQCGG